MVEIFHNVNFVHHPQRIVQELWTAPLVQRILRHVLHGVRLAGDGIVQQIDRSARTRAQLAADVISIQQLLRLNVRLHAVPQVVVHEGPYADARDRDDIVVLQDHAFVRPNQSPVYVRSVSGMVLERGLSVYVLI